MIRWVELPIKSGETRNIMIINTTIPTEYGRSFKVLFKSTANSKRKNERFFDRCSIAANNKPDSFVFAAISFNCSVFNKLSPISGKYLPISFAA